MSESQNKNMAGKLRKQLEVRILIGRSAKLNEKNKATNHSETKQMRKVKNYNKKIPNENSLKLRNHY